MTMGLFSLHTICKNITLYIYVYKIWFTNFITLALSTQTAQNYECKNMKILGTVKICFCCFNDRNHFRLMSTVQMLCYIKAVIFYVKTTNSKNQKSGPLGGLLSHQFWHVWIAILKILYVYFFILQSYGYCSKHFIVSILLLHPVDLTWK